MFRNRNINIRDFKKEAEIQQKRINSAYHYRFKYELIELTRINKRRATLFDLVAKQDCTDEEKAEYAQLNKRKPELDDLLRKGKQQIIKEIGNKF